MRSRQPRHAPAIAGLLLLLALPASGCSQADAPTRPSPAPGQGETGQVPRSRFSARNVQVQDGDSFIAMTSGGDRRTIRLNAVDAPERFQPYADQSRGSLRRLLEDRELRIEVATTDQYGRVVAQVFFAGVNGEPVDVGLAQIEAGMAWFFRRHQRDLTPAWRKRYADAQRHAQAAAKGLWQQAAPEAPWQFRRQQAGERDHNR